MIVKILGSAAGGGFPQWNCNTTFSRRAWDHDTQLLFRTQSSLAASADGENWVIFNASPDIRQQIFQTSELQPRAGGALRDSPIKAVVITNADVDHVAGLLSIRERQPFLLFASDRVLATLKANSIFNVLADDVVARYPITLDAPFEVAGLTVTPFDVPGKVPLFLETDDGEIASQGLGDTIGLEIASRTQARIHYVPGCAALTPQLLDRLDGSDCLLFDGTVFEDDELIKLGVSKKSGRRMGHMPIAGDGGSLYGVEKLNCRRKIYIHINTTNPILDPSSDAAFKVKEAGWDVGYDGLTLNF